MKCTHPGDQVVADILQADSVDTRVRWCRICGAYAVSHPGKFERETTAEKFTAWEVPLGKPLAPIGDRT